MTKELTNLTPPVSFLEEENRWLKSQLFGRSSETRPQDIAVEQQHLFNEAEGLAANVITESLDCRASAQKDRQQENPSGRAAR